MTADQPAEATGPRPEVFVLEFDDRDDGGDHGPIGPFLSREAAFAYATADLAGGTGSYLARPLAPPNPAVVVPQPEDEGEVERVAREYRPTMHPDVLRSWAADMQRAVLAAQREAHRG